MFSADFTGSTQTAIFLFGLLTAFGIAGAVYLVKSRARSQAKGVLFFASILAVGLNVALYAKIVLVPTVQGWTAASYFNHPLDTGIPKATNGKSLHIAVPRHDGNLCIEILGQSSFHSNYCWIHFPFQIADRTTLGKATLGKMDFIVTGTGPYKHWTWTNDSDVCRALNPHHPVTPCIASTIVERPDTDLRLDAIAGQTGRIASQPVVILRLTDTRTGKLVDEFHHAKGQRRYTPLAATLYTRRTDGPIRQMLMSD